MKIGFILAGGTSWRLKPQLEVPKPLLPFGKQTLLELQVNWLLKHGLDKVIISTNSEVAQSLPLSLQTNSKVSLVVETTKLGTAGAVKLCLDKFENSVFYVSNVDDLLLTANPNVLLELAEKHGSAMFVAKPRMLFGSIHIRGALALRFQEKPLHKDYCSCGHYAFKVSMVKPLLPAVGSLEYEVLPGLAKQRKLAVSKFKGAWITINTVRDYLEARNSLVTT